MLHHLRADPRVPRIASMLLLALMVLAVLLSISPLRYPVPNRDSGVFLYTGWRWLAGDVPYLTVWDHKPPAIYAINALGLLITPVSRWGVWFLELISLAAAAFFSFDALRRWLSPLPALIASMLWLAAAPLLLQGGNLTEEYALPLQFAAFWLFLRSDHPRHFAIIGILGAFAFLLRQNLIGLWIALALILLITRRWRDLASLILPAAAALCLIALIFASMGALDALWEAAFEYNFAYVDASIGERVRALFGFVPLLFNPPIFLIGMGVWLVITSLLLTGFYRSTPVPLPLKLALIALPVELILSSLSQKGLLHYYLAWLPVLAILAAYLIHEPRFKAVSILVAALIALWHLRLLFLPTPLTAEHTQRLEAAALITAETTPTETVLLWGAEARVNFLSQRAAPTRFVYQYPLYTGGPALMARFLADLTAHPPALILDTSPSNPLVPPLETVYDVWLFVSEHYEAAGIVGPDAWPVYRLKSGE